MEIVTYVVEGSLTHEDSIGTMETLKRGSIQFMTAGTGVQHSERNDGDKPLRFIQTWILPSQLGLTPNYGSCSPPSSMKESRKEKNQWNHLISNKEDLSVETPVKISQDVDAYAAELELNNQIVHELPKGRQAYLLCLEGKIKLNGVPLERHDGCEITGGGGPLKIIATDVEDTENGKLAHVLMFTMKEVSGSGRQDF